MNGWILWLDGWMDVKSDDWFWRVLASRSAVGPGWETNWAFNKKRRLTECWMYFFGGLFHCPAVILTEAVFRVITRNVIKTSHPKENTGTVSRRTLLPLSLSTSRGLESLVVLTRTWKMSKVVYGKFCTVYKVLVLPISQTELQDVLSERWPQDDRHIPSLSGDVINPPPPFHQAPPALHLHKAS